MVPKKVLLGKEPTLAGPLLRVAVIATLAAFNANRRSAFSKSEMIAISSSFHTFKQRCWLYATNLPSFASFCSPHRFGNCEIARTLRLVLLSFRQFDTNSDLIIPDIHSAIGEGRGTPDDRATEGGIGWFDHFRSIQFLKTFWR